MAVDVGEVECAFGDECFNGGVVGSLSRDGALAAPRDKIKYATLVKGLAGWSLLCL